MAIEIKPPVTIAQAVISMTGGHAFEDLPRQLHILEEHKLYAIFFPTKSVALFLDYSLTNFAIDFVIDFIRRAKFDPEVKIPLCSLSGKWELDMYEEPQMHLLHSRPVDAAALLSLSRAHPHEHTYAKLSLKRMFIASAVVRQLACNCIVPAMMRLMIELELTDIKSRKHFAYTAAILRTEVW